MKRRCGVKLAKGRRSHKMNKVEVHPPVAETGFCSGGLRVLGMFVLRIQL